MSPPKVTAYRARNTLLLCAFMLSGCALTDAFSGEQKDDKDAQTSDVFAEDTRTETDTQEVADVGRDVSTDASGCAPGYAGADGINCTVCSSGTYCAGGQSEPVDCAVGATYDHDLDPSTPCRTQVTCAPGEEVAQPGDATTARVCSACPAGTYSAEENAAECTPWTDCAFDEIVKELPTSESQRQCETCPAGSAPIRTNATACNTPSDLITMGDGHLCILDPISNQFQCTGRDDFGQRGPNQPNDGYDFISAAGTRTCGIRHDNAIVDCWGKTSITDHNTPPTWTRFKSISVGESHACGIRQQNSRITCWGNDFFGQAPTTTMTAFKAVAVGNVYSCGITRDGANIRCWGSVTDLQPPTMENLRFKAISAGNDFICAIEELNSTVGCWGADDFYQTSDPTIPSGRVISVAAGKRHACAILENQTITCWGDNQHNQQDHVPDGLFKAITAAGDRTCAIAADDSQEHSVQCWGGQTVH